jgi:hypothetical protein
MTETGTSNAQAVQRRPAQDRRVDIGSLRRSRAMVALVAAAVVLTVACTDTAVPYFDAPTSVPTSAVGIQDAVSGLFSGTRTDVLSYISYAGSFGRDIFEFQGASPGTFGNITGLKPITNSGPDATGVWDNEYLQIRQVNSILAALPKVGTYSTKQAEAIVGVVQTMKALNFMMVAETRDTIGIPLYAVDGDPTSPPYCNMDVWKYIVALLDSANDSLNLAASISLPVSLPLGFASVSQSAGPSTVQGSFAAFNRALAGKAGLQYAYAIARNAAGTHPTLTSPGAPDVGALTRADSALTSSALYNPSVIAPPAAGSFVLDAYGVYHTFSGQSSDQQNGFVANFFLYDALYDLQFDVDTIDDARWHNKFVADTQPVQLSQYAGVSDAKNYLPYANVSSPVPIVRAEELALVRAQIQLGLGNLANAITLINQVHMQAGGFGAPLSISLTYTAVRDSLLKEQRISTVYEASGDRMIALRMYGLEAVADTTWQAKAGPDAAADAGLGTPTDYHTTVASVPLNELTTRGGQWTLSCP